MNKKTKEAKSENTNTSYTDPGFNTKMGENKVLYRLWQKGEYEECMNERKYGIDFELTH